MNEFEQTPIIEERVIMGSAFYNSVTENGTRPFPEYSEIIEDGKVIGITKYIIE